MKPNKGTTESGTGSQREECFRHPWALEAAVQDELWVRTRCDATGADRARSWQARGALQGCQASRIKKATRVRRVPECVRRRVDC